MLDDLARDGIHGPPAPGLSQRSVRFARRLRNALLALLTIVGLSIPTLVAGNLLIEVLFHFQGLGLLFSDALDHQDDTVLLACTILGGILTVAGGLVADVATAAAGQRAPPASDPRGSRHHRLAGAGLAVFVFFVLFSFLGPLVHPTNQSLLHPLLIDRAPGGAHLLGTDEHGFDELGRIMLGGQTAIEIGVLSSAIAIFVGALYGTISGLAGGVVDGIMTRFVDVLLSIPFLFIVLALATRYSATVLEESLILAAFSWLIPSRLVRREVLTLRARGRHAIRDAIRDVPAVVIATVAFGTANSILALSYLGFLGFGLRYPGTSWGDMLATARQNVTAGEWWLVYPVGGCLVLVVLAANLIGAGLLRSRRPPRPRPQSPPRRPRSPRRPHRRTATLRPALVRRRPRA